MKAVARNKMNIKYAYYKVLETCFGSQSTIKCISSLETSAMPQPSERFTTVPNKGSLTGNLMSMRLKKGEIKQMYFICTEVMKC